MESVGESLLLGGEREAEGGSREGGAAGLQVDQALTDGGGAWGRVGYLKGLVDTERDL